MNKINLNDFIDRDLAKQAIQLGRVEPIPTLEKHYKHFAHRHVMEFNREVARDENFVTKVQGREIFGLYAPTVFGEQRVVIDVTGIKYALAKRTLQFRMFEAQLNAGWVEYIYKSSGCEEDGISRLRPADLRRPGIYIWWGGNNQTQVDGSHRLVRRWREGLKTFEYAAIDAAAVMAGGFLAPEGDHIRFMRNPTNAE